MRCYDRKGSLPVEQNIGFTILYLLQINFSHVLIIKFIPLLAEVIQTIGSVMATWTVREDSYKKLMIL